MTPRVEIVDPGSTRSAVSRATMRIGELSQELETAKLAGRGTVSLPSGGKTKAAVLKAAGLSLAAAHRAERLAAIAVSALPLYEAEAKERMRKGGSEKGSERFHYPIEDPGKAAEHAARAIEFSANELAKRLTTFERSKKFKADNEARLVRLRARVVGAGSRGGHL